MTRQAREPLLDRANGRPTEGEALEFARQVAGLASSGQPLPSGLRALGEELPNGRLRKMLESVAGRVESGESLEEAMVAEGPSFPAPLRGLVAAGVRSGKLAEALGRFLDVYDLGDSLGRQLKFSLIYPTILMVTSFAMFVFVSVITAHGFASIFSDFGINLPWITVQLVIASKAVVSAGWWLVFGPILAVAVLWMTMRLTLGSSERARLVQSLPLIGPLARDTALAQFCPILALLLESDVPLAEALTLAGESSRDSTMLATAREMARDVSEGQSLGEAVADRRPFPRGFGAFLDWAQDQRGLVEALRLSAETFEVGARSRAAFLSRFCNIVSMVVVLWWVALTVVALFLPMIWLMSAIGGSGSGSTGWLAVLTAAALGVLGVLGVLSVIVIVWPVMARGAAIAAEGLPRLASRRHRYAFWYMQPVGLTMLGSLVILLAMTPIMNWLLQEWLPSWWLEEIWPRVEWLGYGLSVVALLITIFGVLVNRRHRKAEAKANEIARVKVRIRPVSWRFGLRHMMFAMAPLALLMVLARDFGWSLLAVLMLIAPPVLVMSAYVVLTNRKVMQFDSLLRVLAMAARDDRPLGPAVAAFSQTCRGRYRRRVSKLAHHLEQGDSLPEALDRVPKVLSRTGEIAARVGWGTRTLGRTLSDAVDSIATERATRGSAASSIGYPLGVLSVVLGVGGFLTLYVGPVFVSIFADFDVPLPEPSATVFRYSREYGLDRNGIDLAIGAAIAAAITVLVLLLGAGSYVFARWLLNVLPLGDWILRRRHSAVILRAMAAATEARQPFPEVLSRLATDYPRPWVRRRLGGAVRRVSAGQDWCDALRAVGLIGAADAAVLRSAERAGNLAWAMRETAASGERRLNYRIQAAGQILQPLVVVSLGGLVLMFVLTYFRPLITLIDAVAESTL